MRDGSQIVFFITSIRDAQNLPYFSEILMENTILNIKMTGSYPESRIFRKSP